MVKKSNTNFDFNEAVYEFLKSHPNTPFKLSEIAKKIQELYPTEAMKKQNKSKNPDTSFVTQFANELVAHRKNTLTNSHPEIRCLVGPYRLFYTEQTIEEDAKNQDIKIETTNNETTQNNSKGKKYCEHDLYPILIKKLFEHQFNIYSMRIDEKRSTNSYGQNGNKWLHPDIVGVQDTAGNWSNSIKTITGQDTTKLKLWSFEVKLKINMSNVRECFFQTVSNSSWANFAYIVAVNVDDKALVELNLLCQAHGIGLLLLSNTGDENCELSFYELNFVIPAKENTLVDWNIVNRISSENTDFKEYVERICEYYQTSKLRKDIWKCG